MKKIIVFLMLMNVAALTYSRINTTRKGLKVNKAKIEISDNRDTISGNTCREITLAGFDKPLRSGYETMFVTNQSDKHLLGIIVECNYTDSHNRQLHRRTITIPCDIPAGQTRQVKFRSWDTQQSFYYRLSPKPRRSEATSFDVTCTVIALITPKTANSK